MGRRGLLAVGIAAGPGSQFVAEAEPKSFGAAPSPREARVERLNALFSDRIKRLIDGKVKKLSDEDELESVEKRIREVKTSMYIVCLLMLMGKGRRKTACRKCLNLVAKLRWIGVEFIDRLRSAADSKTLIGSKFFTTRNGRLCLKRGKTRGVRKTTSMVKL